MTTTNHYGSHRGVMQGIHAKDESDVGNFSGYSNGGVNRLQDEQRVMPPGRVIHRGRTYGQLPFDHTPISANQHALSSQRPVNNTLNIEPNNTASNSGKMHVWMTVLDERLKSKSSGKFLKK